MNGSTNTIYNELFFDYLTERSLQSARVIVPILLNFMVVEKALGLEHSKSAVSRQSMAWMALT